MTAIVQDLRLAVRQARRAPVVGAVALLSLALGIGANVAIFSLVNALILKPLPIHEPERLVQLQLVNSNPREITVTLTHPQWEYIRDHVDVMAAVTAMGGASFNLAAAGESRAVPGMFVAARFLDVLGVTPILGRGFTAENDRRGSAPVAMLSYGFWQREYGGDRSVLGRSIALDGHAFTIIGVTPPGFLGLEVGHTFDVMVPIPTEAIIRGTESSLDRRSNWWLRIFGRLAPGQTMAQAEAGLRAHQPQLRDATMPQDWTARDQAYYLKDPFGVIPAANGISGLRTRYSRALYVLLGIVALVLAIACANMANLLLAQSLVRRRELALRLSLGAGRWQLLRQLLVESVMLSTIGALGGLAIAAWGSRALVTMLSSRFTTVTLDLSMDWRVLVFTAGVGVMTGLLFGVAPAVRGSALRPIDALRDQPRGGVSGGRRFNLGHALVALQVALSFVLVCGSTLFVRTLVGLTSQPLGFESDRVLIASVDLRRSGVAEQGRRPAFEQVREAVAGVPGIEAAAVALATPVSQSSWGLRVSVPEVRGSEQPRSTLFNAVTPGYFKTLGTPLLAGRDISPADAYSAPAVVVVNQAFARKFFAGEHPLGRTIVIERWSADRLHDKQAEIVGLVADAKYRTLREEPQATIYAPFAQQDRVGSMVRLAIKTAGDPWAARQAVAAAVGSVHKEIVVSLRTLDEDIGLVTQQERLIASLSAFFGGLALLLAALGLYGVMSYSVSRRTNEIGIRVALGAEPDTVIKLVLKHVALITVVGLAIGAAAAVGSGRFINALLFNLATYDRTMIAMTAAVLSLAAAVAGYLPARRAARIDPMTALREE